MSVGEAAASKGREIAYSTRTQSGTMSNTHTQQHTQPRSHKHTSRSFFLLLFASLSIKKLFSHSSWLYMYIAGCMQQQDRLDVAPGGDKNKYKNIVAEGLPHGGLRGDDETERSEYFHFGHQSSHEYNCYNRLLAFCIPF
jgi:hypothetical protein